MPFSMEDKQAFANFASEVELAMRQISMEASYMKLVSDEKSMELTDGILL